ncbi:MAG: hypothetical protein GH151_10920 [Bacteroidetes bacterium]|nr:hypothetical protein [Bacteroidota bacterium]
MKDQIIAITGHRVYPDRAALYSGLDNLRAQEYYFGGARGIDSDALEYISRTQPRSIRTVVVPNRVIDQPLGAQAIIEKHATRVIELRNTGPDRYMIRNKFMVDNSEKTVAFYDFRGKGGTFNTIEYAKSKGKDLKVYSLRDFTFNEFQGMSKQEFGSLVNTMKNYKVNLSAVKSMLLRMIIENYHMTVEAFSLSLGYDGVKTLEQLWLR